MQLQSEAEKGSLGLVVCMDKDMDKTKLTKVKVKGEKVGLN